jgi:hypothetical protein
MKVYYDDEVDALYLKLEEETPLKYNVFNFHFVKGYLADKAKIKVDVSSYSINNLSFPKINIKRPLSEYSL